MLQRPRLVAQRTPYEVKPISSKPSQPKLAAFAPVELICFLTMRLGILPFTKCRLHVTNRITNDYLDEAYPLITVLRSPQRFLPFCQSV